MPAISRRVSAPLVIRFTRSAGFFFAAAHIIGLVRKPLRWLGHKVLMAQQVPPSSCLLCAHVLLPDLCRSTRECAALDDMLHIDSGRRLYSWLQSMFFPAQLMLEAAGPLLCRFSDANSLLVLIQRHRPKQALCIEASAALGPPERRTLELCRSCSAD